MNYPSLSLSAELILILMMILMLMVMTNCVAVAGAHLVLKSRTWDPADCCFDTLLGPHVIIIALSIVIIALTT